MEQNLNMDLILERMKEKIQSFQSLTHGVDTIPTSVCTLLMGQLLNLVETGFDLNSPEGSPKKRKREFNSSTFTSDAFSGFQMDLDPFPQSISIQNGSASSKLVNNSSQLQLQNRSEPPDDPCIDLYDPEDVPVKFRSAIRITLDEKDDQFYFHDRTKKKLLTELIETLKTQSASESPKPGNFDKFKFRSVYLTLPKVELQELISIRGEYIKHVMMILTKEEGELEAVKKLIYFQLPNLETLLLDVTFTGNELTSINSEPMEPQSKIKLLELKCVELLTKNRCPSLVPGILKSAVNLKKYNCQSQKIYDDQSSLEVLLGMDKLDTVKIIVLDLCPEPEKLDYLEKFSNLPILLSKISLIVNDNFEKEEDPSRERAVRILNKILESCTKTLKWLEVDADHRFKGLGYWEEVKWPCFENVKRIDMTLKFNEKKCGVNFQFPVEIQEIFPQVEGIFFRITPSKKCQFVTQPFRGISTSAKTIKFQACSVPAFMHSLKPHFPNAGFFSM